MSQCHINDLVSTAGSHALTHFINFYNYYCEDRASSWLGEVSLLESEPQRQRRRNRETVPKRESGPLRPPPVHPPAHWHPQISKEAIIATSPERTRTAICLSVMVRSSAPQTQACQYFTLPWPSLPHNTTARAAASHGVRSWIKNDWIMAELYLICIKLSSAK